MSDGTLSVTAEIASFTPDGDVLAFADTSIAGGLTVWSGVKRRWRNAVAERPGSERASIMNDAVGMKKGAGIVVMPYDSSWPDEYQRVHLELTGALPPWIVSVNHVGSTSVPGLDAKPIIDVLVGVPNLGQALELVPTLEALGFEYRSRDDLPDRHYFPRTMDGLRKHHVSLAEPGSRFFRNTLTFRDALRADTETARRYGRLKHRLAAEVGTKRLAYLNGKTDFVLSVLAANGGETAGDYPVRNLGSSAP